MTEETPWSMLVRLQDVPESGRQVVLDADAQTRERVAAAVGIPEIRRLQAQLDLHRRGSSGISVSGRVCAEVVQQCVVSLEPVPGTVDESVDLAFSPDAGLDRLEEEVDYSGAEPPESLQDGQIDLAAIAVEFLSLGLDPYPRKPGVVFEPPAEPAESASPFAALARFKHRTGR